MIFGLTYYEICFDFLVYSFLGWVLEVVFHAVKAGKIINRGFLNGPVCPVYGFGVVGFLMILKSLNPSVSAEDTNIFVLFAAGSVFCSAIELFAGWLLDKLFHMRWWDYSREPFNLHGYICLRFSLLWGIACMVVVGMIYPMINQISVLQTESQAAWIVMLILYIIYFVDLLVTVSTIIGLNRKLKEIDVLQHQIRSVSDHMTQTIGTTAYKAGEKVSEQKVQADLAKEDLKEMARAVKTEAAYRKQDMNENLLDAVVSMQMKSSDTSLRISALQKDLRTEAGKKASNLHRMLTAFPDMQSHISHDTVEDLKKQIQEKIQKKNQNPGNSELDK